MTADTPAPDAQHPDAPLLASATSPTASPRRGDWRPKLRWFVAEIAVVVTGVLIALALNAWWQGRRDAAQERSYLVQLAEDLRETEHLLVEADSIEFTSNRAIGNLERAYYLPERPPRDSLLVWAYRAGWIWPIRPVLGTAEALVSTGDLGLIRDDSLRTAITAYLDDVRRLIAVHDDNTATWFASARALSHRTDRARTMEVAAHETFRDSLARTSPLWPLPNGPRRNPFPFDADAFLTDRETYASIVEMSLMKQNLWVLRQMMKARATALRARVDAALTR